MSVEILSELLMRKRKALNLTQEDFAEVMGVTQQAYGKWEAGLSTPRDGYMRKVAEILNISMEEAIEAKLAQKRAIQMRNVGASPVGTEGIEAFDAGQPKLVKERGLVGLTGYGLVTMLASALNKGKLQQHQIDTLGSLVNSFVRSSVAQSQ